MIRKFIRWLYPLGYFDSYWMQECFKAEASNRFDIEKIILLETMAGGKAVINPTWEAKIAVEGRIPLTINNREPFWIFEPFQSSTKEEAKP